MQVNMSVLVSIMYHLITTTFFSWEIIDMFCNTVDQYVVLLGDFNARVCN